MLESAYQKSYLWIILLCYFPLLHYSITPVFHSYWSTGVLEYWRIGSIISVNSIAFFDDKVINPITVFSFLPQDGVLVRSSENSDIHESSVYNNLQRRSGEPNRLRQ